MILKLFFIFIFSLIYSSNESLILSPDVQTLLASKILDPVKPHLVFNHKENELAWLNDMSNRLSKWVKDKEQRKNILTIVQYEATRAGLNPQLILSIITIESKFNKNAISNKGAVGLMQVMPFWKKLIGNDNQDLFDFQTNIRYGCIIFRYYLELHNWSINKALQQYNGSNGQQWYPVMVENIYNKYWKESTVVSIINNKIKYTNYSFD